MGPRRDSGSSAVPAVRELTSEYPILELLRARSTVPHHRPPRDAHMEPAAQRIHRIVASATHNYRYARRMRDFSICVLVPLLRDSRLRGRCDWSWRHIIEVELKPL